ncbi:MAG: citryl-CoA lyase [Pandoraea sp.]|uniref:citryl-CoA lyase n=1 Tax=Pandoraea sp. 64-18 TaxID=1895806 RepID=UPI00095EFE32|nr:citryl-CoA lyase [Pandoraea sp. 64-18]MBN9115374.1 citryl-CoA lyase [Pandoraea sp.]OJY17289.1 MAG: citryl-CoA lyase [Pandoraea sp. 64-18]
MNPTTGKPWTPPEQWWKTSIIDVQPGEIGIRGYPIETLIGNLSYAQMVWLMLRGEVPSKPLATLLEAALVAAVDHGPQAPSIAIARMSMTCGVDINNAMASAINVLGDVHGGAGQQCMDLFRSVLECASAEQCGIADASDIVVGDYQRNVSKMIPGYGHRFHPVDPRATRLLALVEQARDEGLVTGQYLAAARVIEATLARRANKPIPINIDGATAVIYSELGFSAALGRGLFILSRSVGILAHAYEQSQAQERIKGPMPPSVPYTYTGPARRNVPSSIRYENDQY